MELRLSRLFFESTPEIGVMVQQLSHDWCHKSFGDVCHAEAVSGRNLVADMHAEYHPANMVARQFGFAQSVPHVEVSCWNTGRHGREKLTTVQYAAHRELMVTWAIKTAFRIGKYVKPKAAVGEAETEPKGKGKCGAKAKTGAQKGKKTTVVARGKVQPIAAKGVPTSTRRSSRLIGPKRATSEASNKSSDEELDSQGSEKGSAAVGDSTVAKKAMSETGGSKSKKRLRTTSSSNQPDSGKKAPPTVAALLARLEQTKAAAYVKVDVSASAPNIPLDDSMAAAIRLVAAEAAQKQIECQVCVPHIEEYHTAYGLQEKNMMLSVQLVDQAAQLEAKIKKAMAEETELKRRWEKCKLSDWTVGTAPNCPIATGQAHSDRPEEVPTQGGSAAPEEIQQDVPPPDEEPLDIHPLQSVPASSSA
ncbi:OLC1v1019325C1 [Oldenlandia corymbosa var. corymbosa]|uniref:OLC1v1019325C1 n=1 Tax=Oldenlandia corymbosa var. corymbosa TaxID=529605 RepID=A0AAV1EDP4_OLDCO|nr:OLC1v1019325C1 [Oldenlandia corymbosa var. corymbosa]